MISIQHCAAAMQRSDDALNNTGSVASWQARGVWSDVTGPKAHARRHCITRPRVQIHEKRISFSRLSRVFHAVLPKIHTNSKSF